MRPSSWLFLFAGCGNPANPAQVSGSGASTTSVTVPVAPMLAPGTPLVAPTPAPSLPPPADPVVELVASGKTCAVVASGAVSCWGDAKAGPQKLPGITDAIGLAITGDLTCVAHRDGTAGCLVDSDVLTALAGAKGVVQIVANGDAVCVRERRGAVACWVRGGPPTLMPVAGLTGATGLVMGTQEGPEWKSPLVSFGCAVTEGGTVSCFEVYRDLEPDGSRQPYDRHLAHKGVRPAQHIGNSRRVKGLTGVRDLIAIGRDRVCARGTTGGFSCVAPGSSEPPEPVPDSETYRAWSGTCIARGTTVTCEPAFSKKSTIEVPGLVTLVDGLDHACALVTTGRVMCWGSDATGGLGIRRPPQPFVADVLGLVDAVDVASTTWGAIAVRANGQLVYWGLPDTDRPTTLSTITDAVHVVGLASHACVLRRDNKVSCWGHGGRLPPALDHHEPTEVPSFAGARDVRITDQGAIARLADGHVVHIGDMALGPSQADVAAPFPGAEHAVDAVVADRWLCTRDHTPGPVTCHAETHDWVAPKLVLDVADVVEMVAVPPHETTSAPQKLDVPSEYGLAFPSAYVALRRAGGEVVQAHLTIVDGVPHVELSPFVANATHLAQSELALCAIGDDVTCHSDGNDQWVPRIPPELMKGTRTFALGVPLCGLRANGHVACVNYDPISSGRGLGWSATLVPVDL